MPLPLRFAVGLTALEAGVLLVLTGLELGSLAADRLGMGLTTAAFFAAYGVGLAACARGLARRRAWARSPVVLTQLIGLGLAYSFRGGDTSLLAAVLALASGLALVAVLHPATTRELAGDDRPGQSR